MSLLTLGARGVRGGEVLRSVIWHTRAGRGGAGRRPVRYESSGFHGAEQWVDVQRGRGGAGGAGRGVGISVRGAGQGRVQTHLTLIYFPNSRGM